MPPSLKTNISAAWDGDIQSSPSVYEWMFDLSIKRSLDSLSASTLKFIVSTCFRQNLLKWEHVPHNEGDQVPLWHPVHDQQGCRKQRRLGSDHNTSFTGRQGGRVSCSDWTLASNQIIILLIWIWNNHMADFDWARSKFHHVLHMRSQHSKVASHDYQSSWFVYYPTAI